MKINHVLKNYIVFSTIGGLLIYGYAFLNMNFTHDSLAFAGEKSDEFIANYLLSIGRFLFFIFYKIFNIYTAPLFCGILSLIFLGIGNFFLSLFFKLNLIQSILISLVVLLSIPYICFTSTYILSAPIFALSYSLTCFALYLTTFNNKFYFFYGTIFLSIAMGGEDQSIIQFGCTMALVYILCNLLKNITFTDFKKLVIKFSCFFIFSGILYYIFYRSFLHFFGVHPAEAYNSLSQMQLNRYYLSLSDSQFLLEFYFKPIKYFIKLYRNTDNFPFAKLFANSVLLIYIIVSLLPIYLIIKNKISKTAGIIFLLMLILSPTIMNSVFILSCGLVHDLMVLSYYFPFYLYIVIYGKVFNFPNNLSKTNKLKRIKYLFFTPLLIPFLSSIILTTNVQSVKEHQFIFTVATINRLLCTLEHFETYVPGKTKIVLLGALNDNDIINGSTKKLPNFTGLNYVVSSRAFIGYITKYLGYKLNVIATYKTLDELKINNNREENNLNKTEIEKLFHLQVFPSRDCIVEINKIFYIRLS